jgi:hypothetical protein
MGNAERELEPVDDDDPSKNIKRLSENDLSKQKIYNFDPKIHFLKD